MSFNELNSVEHYIIHKLSGKDLNAIPGGVVQEPATPYGSFPWEYKSAAELNRATDQVLLESELREALIHLNLRIPPAQDQAVIAAGAFIAFTGLQSTPKPDRLEA